MADDLTNTEQAEHVEAMIRKLMREHALIAPRGFDSQRDRDRLHRLIDDMLDEHALLARESLLEAALP